MHKIALLTCHNQYETKQYFTLKFAEALNRCGIDTSIFTWEYGPVPQEIITQIDAFSPDMTFSFHQLPPQPHGPYFWDEAKRPHWTYLLDPAFYDLELMQSPYSILSCVDRFDCGLLRSYHFKNVFFFPHAIERELFELPRQDQAKEIDAVMLGSCYDPDNLRAYWQNIYPAELNDALDDAIELFLSDNRTTFVQATMQSLAMHEIDPHEVRFDQLAYYVDAYARGINRIQLIRSVKDAQVHVYGGKCWREEKPIEDWSYYLSKQPNVTIHPAVNYDEAMQILKRSKFCLNSMPFFKNGSHERVFASYACGALPVTNDNPYMREQFDSSDILLYRFTSLSELNDKINALLGDESLRRQMVEKGKTQVMQHHTWDQRAREALEKLADF